MDAIFDDEYFMKKALQPVNPSANKTKSHDAEIGEDIFYFFSLVKREPTINPIFQASFS